RQHRTRSPCPSRPSTRPEKSPQGIEKSRFRIANGAGSPPPPERRVIGLSSNRRAIETALNGAGYIALFVDEFSTRGLKETCSVDFPQLVPDAFGALAYLSGRPDVDARRVAIVGFSQGADGALAAAASPEGAAHGVAADLRFRAAAAFYPPCA